MARGCRSCLWTGRAREPDARPNHWDVWTGHYNVNRGYSANGLNQYTASGSVTPSYDGNGNLISDGTTSFGYDAENHLVSASGGHTASLAYDPVGRLWQMTATATTQFLYDGDALLAEFDGSGNYGWRDAARAMGKEPPPLRTGPGRSWSGRDIAVGVGVGVGVVVVVGGVAVCVVAEPCGIGAFLAWLGVGGTAAVAVAH